MNAETYAQVKDRPLAEVLEEFHLSYRDALALAESLSEEQLQTAYTGTWPMGPLWTGVAEQIIGQRVAPDGQLVRQVSIPAARWRVRNPPYRTIKNQPDVE